MASKRTMTQRVRISPAEDEAWRAAARAQGVGVSELLRAAMEVRLRELGGPRQLEDQEPRQTKDGVMVTEDPADA